MTDRHDIDLAFLATCDDHDLDNLVYVLTHDTDGEKRLTEELTNTDNYKKHYPQHSLYWQAIAAEIQRAGANSFASLVSGKATVPYREVLADVYNHITHSSVALGDSVAEIEEKLLSFIWGKSIAQLSTTELEALAKEVRLNSSTIPSTAKLVAATPTDNFFTKALSLLVGPKVYGSTLFSKEKAITAPAYRITVPAVIQVALLRKTHQQATMQ